jgi:DNA-binding MarR family transcriptional regulator
MRNRPARRDREPGLGILAAHLLFAVQDELYRRLAAAGHAELRPRHGIVLAYLDEGGSRATVLAARSGRHKQIVGRTVDELAALGYVTRAPDPADRRAKLVVPTALGTAAIRLSDRVMTDLGRRAARAVGADDYDRFLATLRSLVDEFRGTRRGASP